MPLCPSYPLTRSLFAVLICLSKGFSLVLGFSGLNSHHYYPDFLAGLRVKKCGYESSET